MIFKKVVNFIDGMIVKNKKNNYSVLIFILISLLYAIGNFIWWKINTPVIFSSLSGLYFQDVHKDGQSFIIAPLVSYVTGFSLSVFGLENYDLGIIACNYLFFITALFFVYKIGEFMKSKFAGNTAMILFALTPAVYAMSRIYGHNNYELMAAAGFNIYSLMKTEYFKNRKWSVIYAFSAGLGLLIKDLFIIYWLFACIYIIVKSIENNFNLAKAANIALVIIITSLTAGWYYFRKAIINKILHDPFTDTVPLWSFEVLRTTTIGFSEELLSPVIFMLFIAGLIWFVIKYKHEYKNIILIWLIIPWTAITLMPHFKCPEYLAGIIPAAVLTAALWISSIRKKIAAILIIIFVIIAGIIQYLDFSYDIDTGLKDLGISYKGRRIMYFNVYTPNVFGINVERGMLNKIVHYINDNYKNKKVFVDTDPYRISCIMSDKHLKQPANIFFDDYYRKIDLNKIDAVIVIGDRTIIETKYKELEQLNKNEEECPCIKSSKIKRKLYIEKIIFEQKQYDKMIALKTASADINREKKTEFFYSDETKKEWKGRIKYIHKNFMEKESFYLFGETENSRLVRILEKKK